MKNFAKPLMAAFALLSITAAKADEPSNFNLVVPVAAVQGGMDVLLAPADLAQAYVAWPYAVDLSRYLSVGGTEWQGRSAHWTVIAGTLPEGLTLGANGMLSGTPLIAREAVFKVRASFMHKHADQLYEILTVKLRVGFDGELQPAYVGDMYHQSLDDMLLIEGEPSFDRGELVWAVSNLPKGLSLDASKGVIHGTPTEAGVERITVHATYKSAEGQTTLELKTYYLNVSLAAATPLPAIVGKPYEGFDVSKLLSVTGASDNAALKEFVKWELASGRLPDGLSLNADTGLISGTPTEAETLQFTVRATVHSTSGEAIYSIASSKITINVGALTPDVPREGRAFSQSLAVASVAGDPYLDLSQLSYSATGLPPGLIMSSNGLLSGTASQMGIYSPELQISYKGLVAKQGFSLPVGRLVSFTAGEDQTLRMVAPDGTLFRQVVFASFGTVGGSANNYTTGWCHLNVSGPISNATIGKASGSVYASRNNWGDPCRNTSKITAVTLLVY